MAIQVGYMGSGARTVDGKKNMPIGRMESGAIKSDSTIVNIVVPQGEISKETGNIMPEGAKIFAAGELEATHFMRLRKMATDKGYRGEDFSRPALIEFIKANNI